MSKAKYAVAALTLSLSGLAFITSSEGTKNSAYLDPVGIPTVCVGHTGPEVKLGQRYSDAVCQDLLKQDTKVAQAAIRRLVHQPITQSQYDALVSFTFNLGERNLAGSTLLKRINAGDCSAVVSEFPRWRFSKGRELPGLLKRRNAEAELWRSGC